MKCLCMAIQACSLIFATSKTSLSNPKKENMKKALFSF